MLPQRLINQIGYKTINAVCVYSLHNQIQASSSSMKINKYFEVDCNKVTVAKQHQEIVIRAKATICFSSQNPNTSGLIFLNADTLRNISEQYNQIFKSQVASSPVSQHDESAPKTQQQNSKPPQKEGNTQENNAPNLSQSPFRSSNVHQHSFERKDENSSSAQPNFRKNSNLFSISSQSNNQNQNNSNNQSSNYNFQNNHNNQNPPNGQGSNIFFAPSSQQRPTIFDTAPTVRSSNSGSSDSRTRTNKNVKLRIQ